MDYETQHKLAESLTADTIDIIPFLPCLLQDFWELGSSPVDMSELVDRHIDTKFFNRFLDLGCGKGAVSIMLSEGFGVHVKGIDIIQEFISEARSKAEEHGVSSLTHLECGDISEAVRVERDYDCVIFGAVGTVLGKPTELLPRLTKTIRQGGYILLDDAYAEDEISDLTIPTASKYLPLASWNNEFESNGLDIVSCITADDTTENVEEEYDEGFSWIVARAHELSERYPDLKEMFDRYVMSQRKEYDDLLGGDISGATWLLRKR